MNLVLSILSLALCIYLTQASKKHKDCKLFGPSQICGIPKVGACGAPKCFSNYCEFVEHNKCNPEASMFRFVIILAHLPCKNLLFF